MRCDLAHSLLTSAGLANRRAPGCRVTVLQGSGGGRSRHTHTLTLTLAVRDLEGWEGLPPLSVCSQHSSLNMVGHFCHVLWVDGELDRQLHTRIVTHVFIHALAQPLFIECLLYAGSAAVLEENETIQGLPSKVCQSSSWIHEQREKKGSGMCIPISLGNPHSSRDRTRVNKYLLVLVPDEGQGLEQDKRGPPCACMILGQVTP